MIATIRSRALTRGPGQSTAHPLSPPHDGARLTITTTFGDSRVVKRKGGANLID
jgi:hypothetical protein